MLPRGLNRVRAKYYCSLPFGGFRPSAESRAGPFRLSFIVVQLCKIKIHRRNRKNAIDGGGFRPHFLIDIRAYTSLFLNNFVHRDLGQILPLLA